MKGREYGSLICSPFMEPSSYSSSPSLLAPKDLPSPRKLHSFVAGVTPVQLGCHGFASGANLSCNRAWRRLVSVGLHSFRSENRTSVISSPCQFLHITKSPQDIMTHCACSGRMGLRACLHCLEERTGRNKHAQAISRSTPPFPHSILLKNRESNQALRPAATLL
ncbi:uncharacterized protein LOC143161987 isoform X6 [Aptenodytes patagonicus]|uniref:uncharacterized protein LOC143161987 isoform X6 n=1 Tax=Aptenodytes patagonicus TaxID=9234 RepID=UPI003F9FB4A5